MIRKCVYCGKVMGSKPPYGIICQECLAKQLKQLTKGGAEGSKGDNPIKLVPIAPSKIELMRAAAEKQLSPEDYQEFLGLLTDLQIYGLTPLINTQLGKLMAKIQWELEIEESPEWAEALQACDRAFLGNELKFLCYDYNVSPHGHKKELCRKLYNAKCPEVVRVMQPYLEGLNEKASISPQT